MKKILYAFCICIALIFCFSSCNNSGHTGNQEHNAGDNGAGEDNNGNGNNNENGEDSDDIYGDYIWHSESSLYVIGAVAEFDVDTPKGEYSLAVSNVFNKLSLNTDAEVNLANDTTEEAEHEIVIGYADREISKIAYSLLDDINITTYENDVLLRYLIYSDGNSIAIAFDRNDENVAMEAAIEYFCNVLVKEDEDLKLSEGVVKCDVYSLNYIHQKRDDEIVADSWENYRLNVIGAMTPILGDDKAKEYANSLVAELGEIYSLYSDDLIDWFAGLYEPYICICDGECQKTRYCGGSGFYYSNSARDNRTVVHKGVEYLLLPDAETTAQVLGFIKESGMLMLQNNDYFSAFPEGEPERIVRFIKSLQDEASGYFYHPQWLSMLGTSDFWDSRRSRDLGYSISTLSCFGAEPTYNTPSGVLGDGILYDGTVIGGVTPVSNLTVPFRMSMAAAVSQVVMTSAVHPHLVSTDSFAKYLATLNLAGNSYYVGNELSSLATQILKRDEELGTEDNPRPLATMLDEWLRLHQSAQTGHWHKTSSGSVYYPINGMLKIATLYNTLELPFPNPLAAARSAFSVIASEEKIQHVCDLYNTWFAVSVITRNLNQYSDNATLARQIISEVRLDAIDAVGATADKMKAHLKEDGSFSYFENRSSSTSQNAPVAIPGTNEGDVNATVIFTYGILNYMFDSLGFGGEIKAFTDCDRERFVYLLEEKIQNCEQRNK